ncbi:hypothetical protein GCK72_013324 [Caenorhabditis remanei]|uniref:Uncharacterized protein n=1 Tax=Caenorhabditis remanei TaxID=31234 RepID=A0A6A5GNI4_CAERE|nr:hypothetical protein GCK72_013324 [Caenorhabditis remanei]KAF1756870.1 hypothetical protein GCK72_013324 [Caenorhabditis remanei]
MRGSTAFTLLLVLHVFRAVLSTKYLFKFDVTLNCSIPNRPFGYNVQFYDKDEMFWNKDDPITELYKGVSPPGNAFFKTEGTLTGDEWLSKYFDVKMVLFHTCNSLGESTRVDMRIDPLAAISEYSEDECYQFGLVADITEMRGDVWNVAKSVKNC